MKKIMKKTTKKIMKKIKNKIMKKNKFIIYYILIKLFFNLLKLN